MNSDFILGGKGAGALMSPNWASWRAESSPTSASDTTAESSGQTSASPSSASTVTSKKDDGIYSARARNRGPDVATKDDLSFKDFVDIVNPLQHVPVLSILYREMTGDKISSFAQVAGSALYGGVAGLASGIANAIIQDETGKDMGGTVMAALTGSESRAAREPIPAERAPISASPTLLAEAAPTTAPSAAPVQAVETAPVQVASADGLSDADADKILDAYAQAQKDKGAAPSASSQLADAGAITSKAPLATNNPAPSQFAQADAADEDSQTALLAVDQVPAPKVSAGANTGAVPGANGNAKFYSLANVTRQGAGQAPKMPLNDAPDVRLKPFSRTAVAHAPAAPAPANTNTAETVPLPAKDDAQKILGLAQPTQAPVAQQGRDLSQKMIEQMMLDGITKYQQGLDNGSLRAMPKVDIEG